MKNSEEAVLYLPRAFHRVTSDDRIHEKSKTADPDYDSDDEKVWMCLNEPCQYYKRQTRRHVARPEGGCCCVMSKIQWGRLACVRL